MEGIESAILAMTNRKSVEVGRTSSPCRSHASPRVGPEEEGFEKVLSELSAAANLNMEVKLGVEAGFEERPGWGWGCEEEDAAEEVEPEDSRGSTTEFQNTAPSTGGSDGWGSTERVGARERAVWEGGGGVAG